MTLRVFREKLIGMDPRDIEGINAVMNRAVAYAGTAKAAVDIAMPRYSGQKQLVFLFTSFLEDFPIPLKRI